MATFLKSRLNADIKLLCILCCQFETNGHAPFLQRTSQLASKRELNSNKIQTFVIKRSLKKRRQRAERQTVELRTRRRNMQLRQIKVTLRLTTCSTEQAMVMAMVTSAAHCRRTQSLTLVYVVIMRHRHTIHTS